MIAGSSGCPAKAGSRRFRTGMSTTNHGSRKTWIQRSLVIAALAGAVIAVSLVDTDAERRDVYLVRADSTESASTLVVAAGGVVVERFEIIDAVGARLRDNQRLVLEADPRVRGVFADAAIGLLSAREDSHYPRQVGARRAHDAGLTGRGVTIAVLDTGLWESRETWEDARGRKRVRATFDATQPFWRMFDNDDDCDDDDEDDCRRHTVDDWNGHGTHVTSIMAGSGKLDSGAYNGIAPNAKIVAVKAFEADGTGTYFDVIRAIDWIVRNRRRHDIDILNLSFGAPAASHYWDDPVNLAVMAAWQRGITVVTAAGNGGPGPMTVGVPGNVPYVITVGAYTDNFTPDDPSDDRLARFSAAGPTIEGFVKPDVVAPGGHMLGAMPPDAWLPTSYPDYVRPVGDGFAMSGTSQAAAVVSGVVALMLEAEPSLSPDDVKCRLLATARPAFRSSGDYAYSVFQQGAGQVDAQSAIYSDGHGCANAGLSIADDLAGRAHFAGPAGVDEGGTYYVVDSGGQRLGGSGFEWPQGALWPEGALWTTGALWTEGLLWNTTTEASDAGFLNPDSLMSQGALWPEGALGAEGMARPVTTYRWVDQE